MKSDPQPLKPAVSNWIANNVQEIRDDAALRVFGALLALTHTLSSYFWIDSKTSRVLSSELDPICWPGLDFCAEISRLNMQQVDFIIQLYGFLSIAVLLLFAIRRYVTLGWVSLFVLTSFKFGLMSIDLRTAQNAHVIVFLLTTVFLFLPEKRWGVKICLVAIYFSAGLLKLDRDWISGDNLGKLPAFLSAFPVMLLTIYVVCLELAFVWALLARRSAIFHSGYVQLLVFQSVAFSFIGYFFPTIMLLFLAFFLIERIIPRPIGRVGYSAERGVTLWALFGLGFVMLQIFPYLLSREGAYNGQGKYYKLNMFESVMQCDFKVTFRNENGALQEQTFFPQSSELVSQRLMCNPVSVYWRAMAACRKGFMDGSKPTDFDLNMVIKKRTDENFRQLLDIKNFCQSGIVYAALKHNDWILIE